MATIPTALASLTVLESLTGLEVLGLLGARQKQQLVLATVLSLLMYCQFLFMHLSHVQYRTYLCRRCLPLLANVCLLCLRLVTALQCFHVTSLDCTAFTLESYYDRL